MDWNLLTVAPNSHRLNFSGVKAGWSGRVLVMSDEHVDNAACDRKLLARHHAEALSTGSPVLKFGDLFCAMQGKWDKRADTHQLRPEHRGNNYLDQLVTTTAELYAPWAQNIALMTNGNHETSIGLRHQTSLLDRLVGQLTVKSGHTVAVGAYSGFLRFHFGTNYAEQAKVLRWHHGYGGGGEVTRGLIDNNRTRGQALADIFYSGHIHRRNLDENILVSVNARGRVIESQQWFLRGSCYKDESHGGNGWHIQQGREARPRGGWWLNFSASANNITCTPTPAL